MSRRIILLIGIACLAAFRAAGQAMRFRVMQYNVENLFDTIADARCDDREFLPASERRWDTARYRRKLAALARVIAAAAGDTPPVLVGLCEVENDSVVSDLCEKTRLRRMGLRYLVTESPDARGIDVALLYHPMRFSPLGHSSLRVMPPDSTLGPTRDILHVWGKIPGGDTLDVFVSHHPSRRGGRRSAAYRHEAARTLRRAADSLMNVRLHPLVLLMGDYNDAAADPSVADGLQALSPPKADGVPDGTALYALTPEAEMPHEVMGTYKYRARWEFLDQIVVSGTLLRASSPLNTRGGRCRIFAPRFILEQDRANGGVKPRRTYLGTHYHGGYSDHLPLLVDLYCSP